MQRVPNSFQSYEPRELELAYVDTEIPNDHRTRQLSFPSTKVCTVQNIVAFSVIFLLPCFCSLKLRFLLASELLEAYKWWRIGFIALLDFFRMSKKHLYKSVSSTPRLVTGVFDQAFRRSYEEILGLQGARKVGPLEVQPESNENGSTFCTKTRAWVQFGKQIQWTCDS